jgi:hypothetical protein
VSLTFAGQVVLRLGAWTATVHACCLLAEQGDARRVQWLGQGLGELALGPPDAAFERWLVAHRAGAGRVTLGEVSAAVRAAALPDLPDSIPPARGDAFF